MIEEYPRNQMDLEAKFSTEEACREYLFRLRWPDGFSCPNCGNAAEPKINRKILLRCAACSHQASVTAGTIFQDTHTPLDSLVSRYLVGNYAEERCQRTGLATDPRSEELRNRVDLAT